MLPTDTLYSTLFSRQPLASYHVSSACLTALDSISSARAQQFLQFKSLTRHVDSHSTTPAQRQNGDKRRLFAAPTKKGRSRNVFIRHNFGLIGATGIRTSDLLVPNLACHFNAAASRTSTSKELERHLPG
jgi:hypothetical protein